MFATALFARVPHLSSLALAAAATAFPVPCSFAARGGELTPVDHCAARTPAGPTLAPAIVRRLGYERGLASIAVDGAWWYRRRDGLMRRMLTFDNGPDYFAEGLARATVGGRLAYVDRRLTVRVATRYTWGEPFAHGRAAVCVGCVEQRVGEHAVMAGGRWGVIDRRGREVVPVRFTADKLPRG